MNTIETRLPFFGVVRVSGADAAVFLHNQLSNDIKNLPVNGAAYASYNSPQGRVLANMLVLNSEVGFLLIMAADLCEAITTRLDKYILRSQVHLTIETEYVVIGCLPQQPQPFEPITQLPSRQLAEALWQIDVPHGGYYLVGQENKNHLPIADNRQIALWERYEISAGFPWISAQTSGKCVAQMLNLHHTGAIHFKKGCYPGQEIIARARYLGQVKRGLVSLIAPVPLYAADEVQNEAGEEVGLIINTVDYNEALAVIKHEAVQKPLFVRAHPLDLNAVFFDVTSSAQDKV